MGPLTGSEIHGSVRNVLQNNSLLLHCQPLALPQSLYLSENIPSVFPVKTRRLWQVVSSGAWYMDYMVSVLL